MTRTGPSRARPAALTVAAISCVTLLIICAVVGPVLFRHAATTINVRAAMQGSSMAHLLGTDSLGRDMLARVMVASRLTLLMAVLATFIGGLLGIVVGLCTAAAPARVGRLISSLIAILVAFPPILLAIFFSVVFGVGSRGAVLAVSAAFLPGFARITETLARSVAHREYVEAARLLAVKRNTIARRHILPNLAEPMIVYVTIQIGVAILALASLSFLGFGVQAPSYDWGKLLADQLPNIYLTPITSLGPAAAIVIAGLTFNLLGEVGASRARWSRRFGRVELKSGSARRQMVHNPPDGMSDDLLRVIRLNVCVPGPDGPAAAVRDVSFTIPRGEILGIVGESGSGKSLTALAAAGMLEPPVTFSVDRLEIGNQELGGSTRLTAAQRRFLGTTLALVYQDPGSTLNPALRLGHQLSESGKLHMGLTRQQAVERSLAMLKKVALPGGRRLLRQYQHELSGGMKQRVSIAMGLVTEPELLLADEPTTALDVTVQAQVLQLLRRIRDENRTAILLISHDIAVVSQICDRAVVMYAGHIVEEGSVEFLRNNAAHPYTLGLLRSTLDLATDLGSPIPVIPGRVPAPSDNAPGCRFAPRCAFADHQCRQAVPQLVPIGAQHSVACWHHVDTGSVEPRLEQSMVDADL